jgi:hypothetical protein
MSPDDLSFDIVPWDELEPYVEGLRALESSIAYPVADGDATFTIDHGDEYHPFFSRMGHAEFLVVEHRERVVGSLAGVWKPIEMAGRTARSLYLADYKLAPRMRGGHTALRMIWWALEESLFNPRLRGFDFAYGAAMRDASGDVTQTFGPTHPGHLLETVQPLSLYFVEPQRLAALPAGAPDMPPGTWLDLSPGESEAIVTTRGSKDLRLSESNDVWPLHHLPRRPTHGFRDYLVECGRLLERREDAVACFALDDRLDAWTGWLADVGVTPGAVCTVHGLEARLTSDLNTSHADYVHLATNHI